MAQVGTNPTRRHRRHADRPRPWAQFPWTLLGMAFITTLFLASYQSGITTAGVETDVPAQYDVTFEQP